MEKNTRIRKINNWCKLYTPTWSFVGSLFAVLTVVATFITTFMAYRELSVAIRQDREAHVPVWEWCVNDSLDIISMSSMDKQVAYPQQIHVIFPSLIDNDSWGIPLSWSTHEASIHKIKQSIKRKYEASLDRNDEVMVVVDGAVPFAACIYYSQYDNIYVDMPVYALGYQAIVNDGIVTIQFKGTMLYGKIKHVSSIIEDLDMIYEDIQKQHINN